jgi:hypothetical protein
MRADGRFRREMDCNLKDCGERRGRRCMSAPLLAIESPAKNAAVGVDMGAPLRRLAWPKRTNCHTPCSSRKRACARVSAADASLHFRAIAEVAAAVGLLEPLAIAVKTGSRSGR